MKMHQKRLAAGLRPDPLGELTTLPRLPSRLGMGKPPLHSPPPQRLRRLEFGAPTAPRFSGLLTQIPGYATDV